MKRNIIECHRCTAKINGMQRREISIIVDSNPPTTEKVIMKEELILCADCTNSLIKWIGGQNPITKWIFNKILE